jgi:hypothetical protein
MRYAVRAAVAALGMAVAWHVGAGSPGAAEEPLTGRDVMKKSRELYLAKDQVSTVTLRKIDKKGDEQRIVTKRYWKAYGGKEGFESKTLFVTEVPPDQRGVGFLIGDYAKAGQPDDLRLYLPSLKQVRRMTTREQDDAFMGSDLTSPISASVNWTRTRTPSCGPRSALRPTEATIFRHARVLRGRERSQGQGEPVRQKLTWVPTGISRR